MTVKDLIMSLQDAPQDAMVAVKSTSSTSIETCIHRLVTGVSQADGETVLTFCKNLAEQNRMLHPKQAPASELRFRVKKMKVKDAKSMLEQYSPDDELTGRFRVCRQSADGQG